MTSFVQECKGQGYCDANGGGCQCRPGYTGPECDRCDIGYTAQDLPQDDMLSSRFDYRVRCDPVVHQCSDLCPDHWSNSMCECCPSGIMSQSGECCKLSETTGYLPVLDTTGKCCSAGWLDGAEHTTSHDACRSDCLALHIAQCWSGPRLHVLAMVPCFTSSACAVSLLLRRVCWHLTNSILSGLCTLSM